MKDANDVEISVPSKDRRASRPLAVLVALATVASVAYLVLPLGGDEQDSRYVADVRVSLSESEATKVEAAAAPDPSQSALRIAIAPVISPEKSLQIYAEFARYLASRSARYPQILQRRSYADINELIQTRRCDIAFVCTYPYLRGAREFGLQALVVPVVEGRTSYRSLIIAPSSSSAGSLLDLRGKRFASADIMSNTGWVYPATWLLERGEDPDRFFSEHVLTGSHDKAIAAVMSAYVDGAAVDSLVYDYIARGDPEIVRGLRIVQESGAYGMPPVVVPPDIEDGLKALLLENLLAMHEDPEGQRILQALGIDRFVTPEPGLYQSALEMARAWERRP